MAFWCEGEATPRHRVKKWGSPQNLAFAKFCGVEGEADQQRLLAFLKEKARAIIGLASPMWQRWKESNPPHEFWRLLFYR